MLASPAPLTFTSLAGFERGLNEKVGSRLTNCEVGWRAISAYTGATVTELRDAVAVGELRCRPLRISRRDLDAWMRLRALRALVAGIGDQSVEIVADLHELVDDGVTALPRPGLRVRP